MVGETQFCLKCKITYGPIDVSKPSSFCPQCGTERKTDNLELRFGEDDWAFIYRRVNGRQSAWWIGEASGKERQGPDLTGNDLIYWMADEIVKLRNLLTTH